MKKNPLNIQLINYPRHKNVTYITSITCGSKSHYLWFVVSDILEINSCRYHYTTRKKRKHNTNFWTAAVTLWWTIQAILSSDWRIGPFKLWRHAVATGSVLKFHISYNETRWQIIHFGLKLGHVIIRLSLYIENLTVPSLLMLN